MTMKFHRARDVAIMLGVKDYALLRLAKQFHVYPVVLLRPGRRTQTYYRDYQVEKLILALKLSRREGRPVEEIRKLIHGTVKPRASRLYEDNSKQHTHNAVVAGA